MSMEMKGCSQYGAGLPWQVIHGSPEAMLDEVLVEATAASVDVIGDVVSAGGAGGVVVE